MENDTLQSILSELQKVNQKLDTIEADYKEFKQTTEKTLANVQDNVLDTRQAIVRIEHEHGQKLSAVFDGYSLLYDMCGEIRRDITYLKNVQEKHDFELKFWGNRPRVERGS